MIVIGDIHGKVESYLKLIRRYRNQSSVQIGDFGFGFGDVPNLPENTWFFRGNHDSPQDARNHPNFLGEYGIRELDGVKFFFLSGAWSIDQSVRIEGKSWWRDEELSIPELYKAIELYESEKPDIVLSHDGPDVATNVLLNRFALHKTKPISTRTGQALSTMYEIYQPKKWIFGHWHVNWRQTIGNTDFRCLAELGWCELESEK